MSKKSSLSLADATRAVRTALRKDSHGEHTSLPSTGNSSSAPSRTRSNGTPGGAKRSGMEAAPAGDDAGGKKKKKAGVSSRDTGTRRWSGDRARINTARDKGKGGSEWTKEKARRESDAHRAAQKTTKEASQQKTAGSATDGSSTRDGDGTTNHAKHGNTAETTATKGAKKDTADLENGTPIRRLLTGAKKSKSSAKSKWRLIKPTIATISSVISGQERRMLRQVLTSTVNIVAVAISPQKNGYILQLHENGQLLALEKVTGKVIVDTFYTNEKSTITIKAACFSKKDTRLFAVATKSNEIHIVKLSPNYTSTTTQQSIPVVRLNDEKKLTIRCMDFSPSGTYLATGGADFVLRLYSVATGALLTSCIGHHHQFIVGIAYSPCGNYIATGCKDKFFRVFQLSGTEDPNAITCDIRKVFEKDTHGRCYAVRYSPNGTKLAVGSDSNNIYILDATTFTIRRTLRAHTDYVRCLSFLSETRLLSGGKDGAVYIFDVTSGQAVMPLRHVGWSTLMESSGNEFITCTQASSSGPVLHMNIFNIFQDNSSEFLFSAINSSAVTALAFSSDGEVLFIGCKGGEVRARQITHFQAEKSVNLFKKGVSAIACSPLDPVIAVTSENKLMILLINDKTTIVEEGAITHSIEAGEFTCLAYSKCGEFLAAGTSTGMVHVFNHDFQLMWEHMFCEGAVSSLDFRVCTHADRPPDDDMHDVEEWEVCESMLAIGCHSKVTYVVDVKRAVLEFVEHDEIEEAIILSIVGHDKEIFSVSFSSDGELLATASRDKTVRLFSMETQQTLRRIEGHSDHVKAVVFTPKRQVVSVSLDSTCRMHPTDSDSRYNRAQLLDLPSPATCLKAASFESRFAQLVAIGCQDGRVALMDFSLADEQPLFRESQTLIDRAKRNGDFTAITKLIHTFPFMVHSEDRFGNTLFHYAVGLEDDQLLAILLQSNLPQFWLPVNSDGLDILQLATANKSRACVKLILDRIIVAKENGRLCPLSSQSNQFLRTLMVLSESMHDIVAGFLKEYGLDDAPPEVTKSEQILLYSDETVIIHSHHRNPKGLWNAHIEEEGLLSGKEGQLVKMQPKYINLCNFAGMIHTDGENDIQCLKNTILHRFVQANDAKLFGNTLMKIVLDYKWQTYAKDIFYREIALFAIFLVLHTWLTFVSAGYDISHGSPVWTCLSDSKAMLISLLALLSPLYFIRNLVIEYRQTTRSASIRSAAANDTAFEQERENFEKALVKGIQNARHDSYDGRRFSLFHQRSRMFPNSVLGHFGETVEGDEGGSNGAARRAGGGKWANGSYLHKMGIPTRFPTHRIPYFDFVVARAKALREFFAVMMMDGWNVLQVMTASSGLCGCFMLILGMSSFVIPMAVGSFLLWLQILYFLRAFEFTGGLVRMVFKVFYYTGPFMSLLVVVLLGSANCLYVLLGSVDPSPLDSSGTADGDESVLTLITRQDSLSTALFTTFKLLVLGDGAIEDGLEGGTLQTLIKWLFVLLMVVVNIFMLNLLINLMDDFMQKINEEEGDAYPFEKARIIAEIELLMSRDELMRKETFPRWLHLLVSKSGDLGEKSNEDEWVGTVQAIRTETSVLERRTKEALTRLEKASATQIEALEKKNHDRINQLETNVATKIDNVAEGLLRIQSSHQAMFNMVSRLCAETGQSPLQRPLSPSFFRRAAFRHSPQSSRRGHGPLSTQSSFSNMRYRSKSSRNGSQRSQREGEVTSSTRSSFQRQTSFDSRYLSHRGYTTDSDPPHRFSLSPSACPRYFPDRPNSAAPGYSKDGFGSDGTETPTSGGLGTRQRRQHVSQPSSRHSSQHNQRKQLSRQTTNNSEADHDGGSLPTSPRLHRGQSEPRQLSRQDPVLRRESSTSVAADDTPVASSESAMGQDQDQDQHHHWQVESTETETGPETPRTPTSPLTRARGVGSWSRQKRGQSVSTAADDNDGRKQQGTTTPPRDNSPTVGDDEDSPQDLNKRQAAKSPSPTSSFMRAREGAVKRKKPSIDELSSSRSSSMQEVGSAAPVTLEGVRELLHPSRSNTLPSTTASATGQQSDEGVDGDSPRSEASEPLGERRSVAKGQRRPLLRISVREEDGSTPGVPEDSNTTKPAKTPSPVSESPTNHRLLPSPGGGGGRRRVRRSLPMIKTTSSATSSNIGSPQPRSPPTHTTTSHLGNEARSHNADISKHIHSSLPNNETEAIRIVAPLRRSEPSAVMGQEAEADTGDNDAASLSVGEPMHASNALSSSPSSHFVEIASTQPRASRGSNERATARQNHEAPGPLQTSILVTQPSTTEDREGESPVRPLANPSISVRSSTDHSSLQDGDLVDTVGDDMDTASPASLSPPSSGKGANSKRSWLSSKLKKSRLRLFTRQKSAQQESRMQTFRRPSSNFHSLHGRESIDSDICAISTTRSPSADSEDSAQHMGARRKSLERSQLHVVTAGDGDTDQRHVSHEHALAEDDEDEYDDADDYGNGDGDSAGDFLADAFPEDGGANRRESVDEIFL